MIISYKFLWELSMNNGIHKKDLFNEIGICKRKFCKWKNDDKVTDILLKLCVCLYCDIFGKMEYINKKKLKWWKNYGK